MQRSVRSSQASLRGPLIFGAPAVEGSTLVFRLPHEVKGTQRWFLEIQGSKAAAKQERTGLLAEIVMRTYFESQGRRAYLVGELVNFDRDE